MVSRFQRVRTCVVIMLLHTINKTVFHPSGAGTGGESAPQRCFHSFVLGSKDAFTFLPISIIILLYY